MRYQTATMPARRTAEITTDGRALRGRESRRRIIEAILRLVGDGNPAPGAEEVAAEAEVGLRTVYRHFDNLDSLYSEMSAIKRAEIMPIVDAPLAGKTWRERLNNLIAKRVILFEKMLPFDTAAALRRPFSPFLTNEHEEMVRHQRNVLIDILPAALARRQSRVEALDLALSLESWRRLRRDQKLSVEAARQTLLELADSLTRT